MISMITAALQDAIAALERDDREDCAYHTGKAGGVAAAVGAFGIKALSMCDDISDAYETGNSGLMAVILAEATERLDNPAPAQGLWIAGQSGGRNTARL